MSEPLEFVRNGESGTVHVIAQAGSVWPAWVQSELADIGTAWSLAVQPALALCGWVGRTAPGFADHYTDCFPDGALCGRCHRKLGEDAPLAFEHEQPEGVAVIAIPARRR